MGIRVSVVRALPTRQACIAVELAQGAVVADALARSGLLSRQEIELERCAVGIFGRLVDWHTPLKDGDRIEIYRELQRDPNVQRRARQQGAKPRGGTR